MSRTRHRRQQKRPDRAVVQHYRPTIYYHMRTKERAALPCGCCIFVGGRLDNGEATTGAQPCSTEHALITERASALLMASLAHPSRRLLVDVCADLLSQAAREML